jgi:hypothetical protein
MRTIKRKRIFGGNNRLHKRKHKKSLKKLRGGVNPLAATVEKLFQLPGITGVYKNLPLYIFPSESDVIFNPPIAKPNLFKGNIGEMNGSVILSDYKALYSIKVGWIYGSHFGNLTIYSNSETAEKITTIKQKIESVYLTKTNTLIKTIFIPPIDDKITSMITPEIERLTPVNELTPWGNKMNYEIELEVEKITGDIDNTFKNIMNKYYEGVIDGISEEKISALTNLPKPGNFSIQSEYNKNIQIRNKNFSDNDFKLTDDALGTELDRLKWGDDRGDNSYKCINKLRQSQEVVYKDITDMFTKYLSRAGEIITIPFNIKYFEYSIPENKPKCQEFIEKYTGFLGPNEEKINHRIWLSLSYIMYSLVLMKLLENNNIYKDRSRIVRFKNITRDDYLTDPATIDKFSPKDESNGYRDFLYKYNINSLIHPIILSKLLVLNINIKATILLTCTVDQDGNIDKIDKNRSSDIYKKIDEDDNNSVITKLTIDGVSIEKGDMTKSSGVGADETKLKNFAIKLREEKVNTSKMICNIKVETKNGGSKDISLECNYDYIEKEDSDANKKNIMIYLFDENEFKHELIEATFKKDYFSDEVYDKINNEKIENYMKIVNKPSTKNFGHTHNFYNLVL